MLRIRIATSLAAWMLMFGFGEEACADFHLVLPGGLGDVEGDFQLLNTPPPANGTRIQWVYSASDFKAVPQGRNSLVSISWRPDESVTGPNHASIDDLELRLSTTNAKPGTLSSSMDDNIGGDELVVYSGAIDFRTEGAGAETGPRAFDYVIDFQTPFVYDQDQGNLL